MFRKKAAKELTVYDALPSLAQLHNVKRENYADIREPEFWEIFESYKMYTCLSVERFYNIFKSMEYIARNNIRGDIVECGVFLGGSIIGAAKFAELFGLGHRKFYIYDTFEGFPEDTCETDIFGKKTDLSTLSVFNQNFKHIVEQNIARSGLPSDQFVIMEGRVEETLINMPLPSEISCLRLDTDYFDSTMIELEKLWPCVSSGGVLIIDDYGHFEGARDAVDKYFTSSERSILLQRIDYTGRCGVKL